MLRLGLLSTARINRLVVAGARASGYVEVVAVASRDRARAESSASEHRIERAHGSYEALLEDPGIDAVYVSLPNALHVEWAIRALEAGKHVLCEKPLSRRPVDVERAFDAADRAGRILAEAFMYRHHPQTRRLGELVEGGAIGRLRLVRSTFSYPNSDETGFRMLPELDGGALMDLGCYCVSVSRFLAGEPESVYAEQVTGATGVDVGLYGTMRFAGDVVAQFDSSFTAPVRQELEAVGEEGSLRVTAPFRIDWGGRVELRRGDETELVHVEEADAYRLEVENLADAVAGAAEPLLGRDDAVGQARTIDALYRSAEAGAAVQYEPNPASPSISQPR